MVESTCLKEKCYIWREEGDKCPFYIQTMWRNEEKPSTPSILEDCAHRRKTLLLMDYSNRAIGIQKDYSNQKNIYVDVLKGVGKIVEEMKTRNKMLSEKLELPYEDDIDVLTLDYEK